MYEHNSPGTLYLFARGRGWWNRARAGLTGCPDRLFSLAEVGTACTIRGRHHAGTQPVPMEQIQGSESRANEFDRQLNPLQDHTESRWKSVAAARRQGRRLPPVDLIRVGDAYFVRDGHHRISVARAMWQQSIDGRVTVWEMPGSLPWADAAPARHVGNRIRQAYAKSKDNGARPRTRTAQGPGSLLGPRAKQGVEMIPLMGAGSL